MWLINDAMGWVKLPHGETEAHFYQSMAARVYLPLLFWVPGLPRAPDRKWDASLPTAQEPVEEHSPRSRPSAVKSEGKFVQIGLHMIRAERALVGAEQPPFHKRHHSVYSRKNFVRIHARRNSSL
jgi:hypothetical protein